jgi:hypothetical protein
MNGYTVDMRYNARCVEGWAQFYSIYGYTVFYSGLYVSSSLTDGLFCVLGIRSTVEVREVSGTVGPFTHIFLKHTDSLESSVFRENRDRVSVAVGMEPL